MGKKCNEVSVEELLAVYFSGLTLLDVAKQFSMSKSGLHKRFMKSAIYLDYQVSKRDKGCCENCGKKLAGDQTRFCSRSCSATVLNRGVTRYGTPGKFQPKPCVFCGKEHRNPKYCSPSCSSKMARKSKLSLEERIERDRLKNLLGVRRYQAKRLGQTPPDADSGKIREFYANCPDGHEVDHIIPISKGGLHHHDNLQYLPMQLNRKKSNKMPGEMDGLLEMMCEFHAKNAQVPRAAKGSVS